jgi:hypothetical protein
MILRAEFDQLKTDGVLTSEAIDRFQTQNNMLQSNAMKILGASQKRARVSEIVGQLLSVVGLVAFVLGLMCALVDPRYVNAVCPVT